MPLTTMEEENQKKLAQTMKDFGIELAQDRKEDKQMTKIIMHGCCGHMGQVISGLVKEDPAAEIVAGIDMADNGRCEYPVFTDIDTCLLYTSYLCYCYELSGAKETQTKVS